MRVADEQVGSASDGRLQPSGSMRPALWRTVRWVSREVGVGLWRPRTGVLAALAASVPVLLFLDIVFLTDTLVHGGVGILGSSESALFMCVAFAAAGPASIVVSDRRNGLIAMLRTRGLTPRGYLAARTAIAAGVAAGIALLACLLAVAVFVLVSGPGPAMVSSALAPEEGMSMYGRSMLAATPALMADLYASVVAAFAAGGLAALGAVVGSLLPVPVLPNVVPLAALIMVLNLARIAPVWGAAAGMDLPAGFAQQAAELVVPALLWPTVAAAAVILVGRGQETLWMVE